MSSGSFARTIIPSASRASRRSVSAPASGATTRRACGASTASPPGCIALVIRTVGKSAIGNAPCADGSGLAVLLDDLAVDFNAETGPIRHLHLTLVLADRVKREMVAKRILLLLEFQDRRARKQARRLVRDGGKKMDRGGKPHGRAPGMRHAFDAVGGGERGDFLALREAAGGAHVRLYDVHRLADNLVAKAPAGEIVLAAGHRHVERPRHLDIAVDVFGRDRFLEPVDVELFELAAEPDRVRHREAMIGIDHQPDVRTDRLAHRRDALMIARNGAQSDLHLDGAKSALDVAFGLLDRFLG